MNTVHVVLPDVSGGCVIGKANMDEYSMGSTSTRGLFGPVKQSVGMSALAHSKDFRIAGGSSGGSAVAVASGFADVYVLVTNTLIYS